MKTKTRSVKSQRNGQRNPTPARPAFRGSIKGRKPQSNTVEYRAQDGRHIVTLNLGEGVFSAVRAVAHVAKQPTPQSYILNSLCDEVAQLLPQITEKEAAEFVQWQGAQEYPAQASEPPLITLQLSEKAYTILEGIAAADGYDNVNHMILANESQLAAQQVQGGDEKEYAKMFGLKVEANGKTRLL